MQRIRYTSLTQSNVPYNNCSITQKKAANKYRQPNPNAQTGDDTGGSQNQRKDPQKRFQSELEKLKSLPRTGAINDHSTSPYDEQPIFSKSEKPDVTGGPIKQKPKYKLPRAKKQASLDDPLLSDVFSPQSSMSPDDIDDLLITGKVQTNKQKDGKSSKGSSKSGQIGQVKMSREQWRQAYRDAARSTALQMKQGNSKDKVDARQIKEAALKLLRARSYRQFQEKQKSLYDDIIMDDTEFEEKATLAYKKQYGIGVDEEPVKQRDDERVGLDSEGLANWLVGDVDSWDDLNELQLKQDPTYQNKSLTIKKKDQDSEQEQDSGAFLGVFEQRKGAGPADPGAVSGDESSTEGGFARPSSIRKKNEKEQGKKGNENEMSVREDALERVLNQIKSKTGGKDAKPGQRISKMVGGKKRLNARAILQSAKDVQKDDPLKQQPGGQKRPMIGQSGSGFDQSGDTSSMTEPPQGTPPPPSNEPKPSTPSLVKKGTNSDEEGSLLGPKSAKMKKPETTNGEQQVSKQKAKDTKQPPLDKGTDSSPQTAEPSSTNQAPVKPDSSSSPSINTQEPSQSSRPATPNGPQATNKTTKASAQDKSIKGCGNVSFEPQKMGKHGLAVLPRPYTGGQPLVNRPDEPEAEDNTMSGADTLKGGDVQLTAKLFSGDNDISAASMMGGPIQSSTKTTLSMPSSMDVPLSAVQRSISRQSAAGQSEEEANNQVFEEKAKEFKRRSPAEVQASIEANIANMSQPVPEVVEVYKSMKQKGKGKGKDQAKGKEMPKVTILTSDGEYEPKDRAYVKDEKPFVRDDTDYIDQLEEQIFSDMKQDIRNSVKEVHGQEKKLIEKNKQKYLEKQQQTKVKPKKNTNSTERKNTNVTNSNIDLDQETDVGEMVRNLQQQKSLPETPLTPSQIKQADNIKATDIEKLTTKRRGDSYTPKSPSWGQFERPINVSKAYGGGRVLKPEDGIMSEEKKKEYDEQIARLEEQRRLKQVRVMSSEPDAAQRALTLNSIAEKQINSGDLIKALSNLEEANKLVAWSTPEGGVVCLSYALLLDSIGRVDEAYATYRKLTMHSSVQIKKRAKALCLSVVAARSMGEKDNAKGSTEQQYEQLFNNALTGIGDNYQYFVGELKSSSQPGQDYQSSQRIAVANASNQTDDGLYAIAGLLATLGVVAGVVLSSGRV